MQHPPELQRLSPALALWHAFDRSVKADLFSTAISIANNTCLVDPIRLDVSDLGQLNAIAPIQAIAVTNQNHWRAATEFSQQLSVPIFAHAGSQTPATRGSFSPVAEGDSAGVGLQVISIDG